MSWTHSKTATSSILTTSHNPATCYIISQHISCLWAQLRMWFETVFLQFQGVTWNEYMYIYVCVYVNIYIYILYAYIYNYTFTHTHIRHIWLFVVLNGLMCFDGWHEGNLVVKGRGHDGSFSQGHSFPQNEKRVSELPPTSCPSHNCKL